MRVGIMFFALTGLVGATAINSGANLTHLLFGAMLGALVVSGILSFLSLRGLGVQRRLPTRVYANTDYRTDVLLDNRKRLLPSFSVNVRDNFPKGISLTESNCYALCVGPRRATRLWYTARCDGRGLYRMRQFRLSSAFPFGFFRNRRGAGTREQFVAYPELGQIRANILDRGLGRHQREGERYSRRAGEDDFFGLTEYRPGDNPKWIHWRTSARFSQLMVRQFVRPSEKRVYIFLDAFPPDGSAEARDHFELAVSFAASAMRQALAAGCETVLVLPGQREPTLCRSTDTNYYRALEELALLKPKRAGFGRAQLAHTDGGFVIAIVSQLGRAESRQVAEMRSRCPDFWLVDTHAPHFEALFELPSRREGRR